MQVEGGIAQGIGMALYEDVVYNKKGKNFSNSLMQYKIPTRLDVGQSVLSSRAATSRQDRSERSPSERL